MPYVVRKQGSGAEPWKIVNKDTGEVVGSSETEEKAQSSANARNASEHGWEPTGAKARYKRFKGG